MVMANPKHTIHAGIAFAGPLLASWWGFVVDVYRWSSCGVDVLG